MQSETLTLEDADLRLTLTRTATGIEATLDDKAAGRRWGPAPLARLFFHNKMYKRIDPAHEYDVLEFQRIDDSIHIVISLDDIRQLSAGLWFSLRNGELVAQLHPPELYEYNPQLFRWAAIDLFPGLMTAGSDGELLLPITTGARCRPRDKARISDRFLIYGEQERSELLPLLPFCAAANPDGGIMALAAKVAADTACFVATDGVGNGSIGFGFNFRRYWPDPVDFQTREIRYAPIPTGVRTYRFVARRLRRHLMQDFGKPTLEQRAAESPEVAYALQAYTMKPFFATQNETGIIRTLWCQGDLGSRTSFDAMMTFKECARNLQRLHEAGVEKVLNFLVGWGPRGHDGLYPTRLPPDPRLGGEEGFRELLRNGQALGYHMSAHDNYIDGYKASPDWDPQYVIQDIYGEPFVMGLWGAGIMHKLWPLAFPPERLEGQMRAVRELGIRGMYYCDAMGNLLDVNYHPQHGGPRDDHAKGAQRVLNTAREIYGAVGTEMGFFYCAVATDAIANAGWAPSQSAWKVGLRPEWPVTELCDQQLPIFQMALHGLVMLEGTGVSWPEVMRKVLFGLVPRIDWCQCPGLEPVFIYPFDDRLVAAIKADYDLSIKRFGHRQIQQLLDCEEVEPGVFMSRFEDDTVVKADFNRGELVVGDEKLEPAK